MRITIFIANKIHDVEGGGPALSVTMTLIFPKIVWTCPLSFHQRTRFGLEFKVVFFIVLVNIEFDLFFIYILLHVFSYNFYVVVHLGDYQA